MGKALKEIPVDRAKKRDLPGWERRETNHGQIPNTARKGQLFADCASFTYIITTSRDPGKIIFYLCPGGRDEKIVITHAASSLGKTESGP